MTKIWEKIKKIDEKYGKFLRGFNTGALFVLFIVLILSTTLPIKNIIQTYNKRASIDIAEEYEQKAIKIRESHREFFENSTEVVKGCLTERCKAVKLLKYLKENKEVMSPIQLEGYEYQTSNKVDCDEYSVYFKELLKENFIRSYITLTKNHAFVLAKLNGKYEFIDPLNSYINGNFTIWSPNNLLKDYIAVSL